MLTYSEYLEGEKQAVYSVISIFLYVIIYVATLKNISLSENWVFFGLVSHLALAAVIGSIQFFLLNNVLIFAVRILCVYY